MRCVCLVEKGGFVRNKRVNGVLAVSRALGDGSLHPFVSPEPHILVTALLPATSSPELLILACDGIWDVLSDQDAADLLASGAGDAGAAANLLKDRALALNSTGAMLYPPPFFFFYQVMRPVCVG